MYENRSSGQAEGAEFQTWLLTTLDSLVHLTLKAASSSSASATGDSNKESYLTEAANLLRR